VSFLFVLGLGSLSSPSSSPSLMEDALKINKECNCCRRYSDDGGDDDDDDGWCSNAIREDELLKLISSFLYGAYVRGTRLDRRERRTLELWEDDGFCQLLTTPICSEKDNIATTM